MAFKTCQLVNVGGLEHLGEGHMVTVIEHEVFAGEQRTNSIDFY